MEDIAETLRAVGPFERYSTTRHALNLHNNVGLTAHYNLPHPLLTKPRIYSALKSLITQLAPLGVTILGESTCEPRFARLKSIDLEEAVETITLPGEDVAGEIDTVLSEQHSKGFELGRLPGWRVLVLREHEEYEGSAGADKGGEGGEGGIWISFIYHHAIGDGVSGMAFHRYLLSALRKPHENPTFASPRGRFLVHPPAREYPPPLESLVALPLSLPYMLSEIWSKLYSRPPPRPDHWSGATIPPTLPSPQKSKTVFSSLHFPPRILARLLSVCRRENTTLTSLLVALVARATFAALPSCVTKLSSSTPINLRRFIPSHVLHHASIGAHVASLKTEHARGTGTSASVFASAREHTGLINDRLDAGTADMDVGMLKWLSDFEGFFKGKLGRARDDSFAVSNVGAWEGAGVDRCVFSQSGGVVGPPVVWCVVGVRGGGLVLGATGSEGAVDGTVLARIIAGVRSGVLGVE